jgi:hypothetical protein
MLKYDSVPINTTHFYSSRPLGRDRGRRTRTRCLARGTRPPRRGRPPWCRDSCANPPPSQPRPSSYQVQDHPRSQTRSRGRPTSRYWSHRVTNRETGFEPATRPAPAGLCAKTPFRSQLGLFLEVVTPSPSRSGRGPRARKDSLPQVLPSKEELAIAGAKSRRKSNRILDRCRAA